MDTSKATELLWNLLSYIDLSSVSEAFAKYLKYLPLFAIGAISSLILTPIVGYIANKYDITYKPGVKRLGKEYDNKEKAMHEGITPSLGGLAITIPVIQSKIEMKQTVEGYYGTLTLANILGKDINKFPFISIVYRVISEQSQARREINNIVKNLWEIK